MSRRGKFLDALLGMLFMAVGLIYFSSLAWSDEATTRAERGVTSCRPAGRPVQPV